MKKALANTAILGILLISSPHPSFARDQPAEATTFLDAFSSGQFELALRYRFEHVDQDSFEDDANASTLRTSIAFTTASWKRFHLGLELESVLELGFEDQFDNKGAGSHDNGVDDRPVIADPELTELNQAFLGLRLADDTTLKVGRFEVALADQRFLGPVGWRQNHQSLEGARFDTAFGTKKLSMSYVYLDEIRRIFGDSKPMASHAVELQLKTRLGAFEAFLYDLDYDLVADAALSTSTWGARWRHHHQFDSGWKLAAQFQAAEQEDSGNNPRPVDAGYVQAEVSAQQSGWTAKVAFEMLEGEPGRGRFSTPLATLHKFNGWADKFLTTPTHGLDDRWLELGWKSKIWAARAVYHRFEAATGPASYGSELDLVVSYKAPWKQQFLLKGAFYEADEHSVDTGKIWLQTTWSL